jgi:hypothetical protein
MDGSEERDVLYLHCHLASSWYLRRPHSEALLRIWELEMTKAFGVKFLASTTIQKISRQAILLVRGLGQELFRIHMELCIIMVDMSCMLP